MAVWKIFVGGAADDWFTHIVKQYRDRYEKANPGFSCRYFSWTDGRAMHKLLTGDAQGGHVTLVGHSLGGNAAYWAMGHVPTVDVLIGVDPVGPLHRDWTSIRAGARVWLNIRAEPGKGHGTTDDLIAGVGRKYPRPPAPGTPSGPNYSIVSDCTHGAFDYMMGDAPHGISGAMLLGGTRV